MMFSAGDALIQIRCIRVNLLGGFALFRADASPVQLTGARARGILTYLLLAPDGKASRERLCELFWGDRGEAQARSSLRQALFDIRAVLQSADCDALVSERDTIRLEKQRISSDVHDLAAVLEAGDAQALTAALAAMGDILLDDLGLGGSYQDWRNQETARLEGVLAASVRSHLAALTARADWSHAKLLAEAWLRRDPLDEETVALAIRADRATGANAAARRRYIAFKELLARELAIAPGSLVESAMNDVAAPDAFTATAPPIQIAAMASNASELVIEPQSGFSRRDHAVAGGSIPSVAVMPFASLSQGGDEDYFVEGMAVEIVSALSRFKSLFVISSGSMLSYRGDTRPPNAIARELGVRYTLLGNVRKVGNRVRIDVELLDGDSHVPIWNQRFDRFLEDVFALQDEVASAVAARIDSSIEVNELQRVRTNPTEDLDAYDLFLRGYHILWASYGEAKLSEAIDLFDRAIACDPGFALAMALCSNACFNLQERQRGADGAALRAKCMALARRAVVADRDDYRALAWASYSFLQCGEPVAVAQGLIGRALAMNPGDSVTHYLSGWINIFTPDPEKARSAFEIALRLDPRSRWRLPTIGGLGIALLQLDRFEEAIPFLKEPVEHLYQYRSLLRAVLAAAYGYLGRIEEARAVAAAGPWLRPHDEAFIDLVRDRSLKAKVLEGLHRAGIAVGEIAAETG